MTHRSILLTITTLLSFSVGLAQSWSLSEAKKFFSQLELGETFNFDTLLYRGENTKFYKNMCRMEVEQYSILYEHEEETLELGIAKTDTEILFNGSSLLRLYLLRRRTNLDLNYDLMKKHLKDNGFRLIEYDYELNKGKLSNKEGLLKKSIYEFEVELTIAKISDNLEFYEWELISLKQFLIDKKNTYPLVKYKIQVADNQFQSLLYTFDESNRFIGQFNTEF